MLKRAAIILVAVVAVGFVLIQATRQPEAPTVEVPPVTDMPFLLGGIQVNEADHNYWMESLQASDMNTVSVTVYAKHGDWNTPNLWFDIEDQWVVHEIRAAKAKGLRVVLILRVALDHAYEANRFMWHGMIAPQGEEAVDSWFQNYAHFIEQWADISEAEGVDVMAVGSEMNALVATTPLMAIPPLEEWLLSIEKQQQRKERITKFSDRIDERYLWVRNGENFKDVGKYLDAESAAKRAWAQQTTFAGVPNGLDKMNARRYALNEHWKKIIKLARQHYSGKLTYAANFDNYREVGFWKELDFIGINAYFKLREWPPQNPEDGGLAEMTESWETVLSDIEGFRKSIGTPTHQVLFTELGYSYRKHCSIEPWTGYGFSVLGKNGSEELLIWQEQPVAFEERANAVRALHQAQETVNPDLMAGILYWKMSTDPWHEEIEPFVLTLQKSQRDPLQDALAAFAK